MTEVAAEIYDGWDTYYTSSTKGKAHLHPRCHRMRNASDYVEKPMNTTTPAHLEVCQACQAFYASVKEVELEGVDSERCGRCWRKTDEPFCERCQQVINNE